MNKLLLLLLLGAAGLGIYFYMNPDQTKGLLEGTPLEAESELTRAYKWQDAQGRWQITDEPPPEGTAYELNEYRLDTIPLPLPPAPKE